MIGWNGVLLWVFVYIQPLLDRAASDRGIKVREREPPRRALLWIKAFTYGLFINAVTVNEPVHCVERVAKGFRYLFKRRASGMPLRGILRLRHCIPRLRPIDVLETNVASRFRGLFYDNRRELRRR